MRNFSVIKFFTSRFNIFFLFFFKNIDNYTSQKNLTTKLWLYYLKQSYVAVYTHHPVAVNFMILYLYFKEKIKNQLRSLKSPWYQKNQVIDNMFSFNRQILLLITSGKYRFSSFTHRRRRRKFNKAKFTKNSLLAKFTPAKPSYLFLVYYAYNFIKFTLISLIFGGLFFMYAIYFAQLQFLKQLAVWYVVLNLVFWLFSGFNFFLKRYKFGKFTSAIQRFWKRANMCFWLIEGFLFLIFFYYFTNSSQEPLYMFDNSSLQQEYLIPLTAAYLNTSILSFIIILLTILMLNISFLTFSQAIFFLSLASSFIFLSFFVESYQIYYVLTLFNEINWTFSEDSGLWELEHEFVRLRTKQYYFLLCLIAKYWHFIFIFLSWVFFIIKVYESKRISYNLLALNQQNLVILFVLNILCYVQWLKWAFRRFLDLPYFWFFNQPDCNIIQLVSWEFYYIIISLFDCLNPTISGIVNLVSLEVFSSGDSFNYFSAIITW